MAIQKERLQKMLLDDVVKAFNELISWIFAWRPYYALGKLF